MAIRGRPFSHCIAVPGEALPEAVAPENDYFSCQPVKSRSGDANHYRFRLFAMCILRAICST